MNLKYLGYAMLVCLIIFGGGIIVGRFCLCPKPQAIAVTSTPIAQPSPQGGSGVLQPEVSIRPLVPSVSQSGPAVVPALGVGWTRYEDNLIVIRVRAQAADSINYAFKKSWHQFNPQDPYVQSLFVYGVAPESVKINGQMPQARGKFPLALNAYAFVWNDLSFDAIAMLMWRRIGVAGGIGTERLNFDENFEIKFRARAAVVFKIL